MSSKMKVRLLSEPFRIVTSDPGTLDNLRFEPATPHKAAAGQVEVRVRAVGINFREVMRALGAYPGIESGSFLTFDGDCAGTVVYTGPGVTRVAIGDDVLGFGPNVFGSFAVLPEELVVPKPAFMSFAEAATIATAFVTAHYALNHLARIHAGEKVLIHAATGGVGLAAIQLAVRAGAEIFATAGSDEKRGLLRSMGIPHVMNSRNLDFAGEVLAATHGAGVDIVLNSLAGEFIAAGLSVLAPFGRFMELGKRDIYGDKSIALSPFRNNLAFFAVDLQQMPLPRLAAMLDELIPLFIQGTCRPLPQHIFPVEDVKDAFRLIRRAAHIGKVVLTLD